MEFAQYKSGVRLLERTNFMSMAFTGEAYPAPLPPLKCVSQTFQLETRRHFTTPDSACTSLSTHANLLRMSQVENSWVIIPNSGKIPCKEIPFYLIY